MRKFRCYVHISGKVEVDIDDDSTEEDVIKTVKDNIDVIINNLEAPTFTVKAQEIEGK